MLEGKLSAPTLGADPFCIWVLKGRLGEVVKQFSDTQSKGHLWYSTWNRSNFSEESNIRVRKLGSTEMMKCAFLLKDTDWSHSIRP